MLLSEFIAEVNYNVRGTDDDSPTVGDTDWEQWVVYANAKKDEMYDSKKWTSAFKTDRPTEIGTVTTAGTTYLVGVGTYFNDYNIGDKITVSGETVRTIATITDDTHLTVSVAFSTTAGSLTYTLDTIIITATQSYSAHRNLMSLSDEVCVLDTDEAYHYYKLIHPEERNRLVQEVFLSELRPKLLTFTSAISSTDQIIGGSLKMPGYYRPADIDSTDEDADIPTDDPHWLAMATAAEVSFNDITYEDKYGDLAGKAGNLWRNMYRNDRRGTYSNPRVTPTNVRRITGFR